MNPTFHAHLLEIAWMAPPPVRRKQSQRGPSLAVLAPHEQGRAQTQQASCKAAFPARLIEIARLALAA